MAVTDHVLYDIHPRIIRRELGLSHEEMGHIMSVSAKAIENWERRNQLPADEERRNRLAAIAAMAHLGLLVYGSAGLPTFLRMPLRSLGNHSPLQDIMTGRIESVMEVLAAEYEGLGF